MNQRSVKSRMPSVRSFMRLPSPSPSLRRLAGAVIAHEGFIPGQRPRLGDVVTATGRRFLRQLVACLYSETATELLVETLVNAPAWPLIIRLAHAKGQPPAPCWQALAQEAGQVDSGLLPPAEAGLWDTLARQGILVTMLRPLGHPTPPDDTGVGRALEHLALYAVAPLAEALLGQILDENPPPERPVHHHGEN
ncbi:MAG: hypothetical protein H7831_11990 [Magnetococcus sp. WYHC-3]